jgi:D-alanyl-D-alanine dipeptidase
MLENKIISIATLCFLIGGGVKAESNLVDLKKLDFSFVIEMPYASGRNLTQKKWYPESRCLLRKEVAEALLRIQKVFQLSGKRLKLLECYIPEGLLQKILTEKNKVSPVSVWEKKFSTATLVAITYVDKQGQELSMPFLGYQGTNEKPKDAFSRKLAKSHHAFLKSQMEKEGFQSIAESDGIYQYKLKPEAPLLDIPWNEVP